MTGSRALAAVPTSRSVLKLGESLQGYPVGQKDEREEQPDEVERGALPAANEEEGADKYAKGLESFVPGVAATGRASKEGIREKESLCFCPEMAPTVPGKVCKPWD
eukprot:CAMPEP_0184501808 /NCGR_PEP_ID=MMETSP0113_2-20130426/48621_1 /TAXON_ID=91329 /ORGANISM="Norrisiella sphaerica, Strain BC52" /LENGTH=105 /DNA_ID=CAMNT_0026890705 /DNA_START=526 /DNA_END=844 /DNA_ORIENTATION=+